MTTPLLHFTSEIIVFRYRLFNIIANFLKVILSQQIYVSDLHRIEYITMTLG